MNINANKFDNIERDVHTAFSNIKVNPARLSNRVKKLLHEDHENQNMPKSHRRLRVAAILTVLLILTAATAYAAVSLGVFDRFLDEHGSPFAEILSPVETFIIDQDIRVDIIGARHFNNNIVMYTSLTDISGQNRLTENTWVDVGHLAPFGSTWTINRLSFDNESNTIYHRHQLSIDASDNVINSLPFTIEHIVFYNGNEESLFPIPLSELGEVPTIYSHARGDGLRNHVLQPQSEGNFPALPPPGWHAWMNAENSSQWISNAAIMDGYLYVQLGSTITDNSYHDIRGLSTSNAAATANFILVAPNGTEVVPISYKNFSTNARFQISSLRGAPYVFDEFVFPIDVHNLDEYTLLVRNYYQDGMRGNWDITVYFDDTSDQIRIWEGPVNLEDWQVTVDVVTISPLGVNISGTNYDASFDWMHVSVGFETSDGQNDSPPAPLMSVHRGAIPLPFDIFISAESVLDISTVTAVIIDGIRIPLD
jgi:hypothetical protein